MIFLQRILKRQRQIVKAEVNKKSKAKIEIKSDVNHRMLAFHVNAVVHKAEIPVRGAETEEDEEESEGIQEFMTDDDTP